jgi:hypothetical protein
MGARDKLNRFHVYWYIGLAALAGLLAGSWGAFGAALALGLAVALHSGGLRPYPAPARVRRRGRPRR